MEVAARTMVLAKAFLGSAQDGVVMSILRESMRYESSVTFVQAVGEPDGPFA